MKLLHLFCAVHFVKLSCCRLAEFFSNVLAYLTTIVKALKQPKHLHETPNLETPSHLLHLFVPFIYRGSALSTSSRRRVDRGDRDFLGSVSSRGAADMSEYSLGPNSSSPLTLSTEDLSIMSATRSISPKRNVYATTTSGLGDGSAEQPART